MYAIFTIPTIPTRTLLSRFPEHFKVIQEEVHVVLLLCPESLYVYITKSESTLALEALAFV